RIIILCRADRRHVITGARTGHHEHDERRPMSSPARLNYPRLARRGASRLVGGVALPLVFALAVGCGGGGEGTGTGGSSGGTTGQAGTTGTAGTTGSAGTSGVAGSRQAGTGGRSSGSDGTTGSAGTR